jgi:preprotein translocase subunit SecG
MRARERRTRDRAAFRRIIAVSGATPMTIAFYAVVFLHIIACLFLIGVVLLQQGKNQDLASAFGGGGTQTAFGPRGSANVLSRATTVLAALFMVTSLALSILRGRPSGLLDRVTAPPPVGKSTAAPVKPAGAPSAPAQSVPPAQPAAPPVQPSK